LFHTEFLGVFIISVVGKQVVRMLIGFVWLRLWLTRLVPIVY